MEGDNKVKSRDEGNGKQKSSRENQLNPKLVLKEITKIDKT